jgi:hypothetical protein
MERLQNTLHAFFQPTEFEAGKSLWARLLALINVKEPQEKHGGQP